MTLRLLLLLAVLATPAFAKEEDPPTVRDAMERVVAGSWFEGTGGRPVSVTALYLRKKPAAPLTVWIGHGGPTGRAPNDGEIAADRFSRIELMPGELVLVRRPHTAEKPASAVFASLEKPENAVDTHELIHEAYPPGGFYFERPMTASPPPLLLHRHVVEIGDRVQITLRRPRPSFFKKETLELARFARRLGIDSGDRDGPSGHVAVRFIDPRSRVLDVHLLEGFRGEKRLRAWFHDSRCAWATQRVRWMNEFFVLLYESAGDIGFTLDTTPVTRAGRVSSLAGDYGAVTIEAIHKNGFGGSSSNLNLPALLVVPKGTAVRQVELP